MDLNDSEYKKSLKIPKEISISSCNLFSNPINYISDWGPNQPCNRENNQDCLQIWHKSDYLWDDEFCTLRHDYICESRYGDVMYNRDS
jgi:hypothetical protein